MTEYQKQINRNRSNLYSKYHRERMKEIKERDNLINMAMRFVFEYEDMSAALRYVKWKVCRMHEERCLHGQESLANS